jgi:hypothetical protein
MRVITGLLALALCVAQTGTSSAQQQISTGNIAGAVRDESGLAVGQDLSSFGREMSPRGERHSFSFD